MNKYRIIEVRAFRRRVTISSGEWPGDGSAPLSAETFDTVSLDDADMCEPVNPDSHEGQLILAEAVRSLERRLSPEARATISAGRGNLALDRSNRSGFYVKLESFCRLILNSKAELRASNLNARAALKLFRARSPLASKGYLPSLTVGLWTRLRSLRNALRCLRRNWNFAREEKENAFFK